MDERNIPRAMKRVSRFSKATILQSSDNSFIFEGGLQGHRTFLSYIIGGVPGPVRCEEAYGIGKPQCGGTN